MQQHNECCCIYFFVKTDNYSIYKNLDYNGYIV